MTGGVIRHGFAMSSGRRPEHRAWTGMKQRCTNPKNPKYPDYGGRGITVCAEWLTSFEAFLADVGLRPSKDHSLEREDTNGNYEPSNCIWATREQQQRNRRVTTRVIFRGESMTLFQALEAAGNLVPYHTAKHRLGQGWSVERAVTELLHAVGRPRVATPVRKRIVA